MAAVLLIALAVAGCHSVTTSPAPQLPSVPPVQRSASNSPGSGASVPSQPPSLPVARVVGARWPLAGSRRPAGALVFHVPIFTYHRIAEAAEAPDALPGLRVSPEIFDAQLTALVEAGWHSITVAQLALDMEANAPPPARTFVVTIDDGYRDGLTNALPIIRGLATADSGDVQRQTNLVVNLYRVASVEDGSHREQALTEALAILERLRAEDKLTPDKIGWPDLIREMLAFYP